MATIASTAASTAGLRNAVAVKFENPRHQSGVLSVLHATGDTTDAGSAEYSGFGGFAARHYR
ncbi:MAG: hypothetical protein QGD91_08260 [Actinomycetota bacterium]|nr:hypothetical protein [Actinomycetota bacterium]